MDVIKPVIVLHTMASPESGYGHLNRCLILSQALKNKGAIVHLLVIGDQAVRTFLSAFPWAVVYGQPPAEWPPADLCIVDMYCYDDDYYTQLRRHYEFIGIFDDVEYHVPKHVCCVINPNLYADASRYPPGIRVFHGAEMVLVRQDFLTSHKSTHQDRILVCVGASDPTNQMDRILRILTSVTAKPIDAVFGPGFEQEEVIERWRHNAQVNCHCSVRNMEQLMQHVCYAVTGCGSMLYECAVMGIPCACLCLAENQKLLASAFQGAGAIEFLGCYQKVSDIEIEHRLTSFDTEQKVRQSMANRAQKLIDGHGADRLSQAILNSVATRKDGTLSPYTKQEIESEYEKSANEAEDYQKLRWGSKENMINRYLLAMRELPFDKGGRWLDIGSGTGIMQTLVEERYAAVWGTGIELSQSLCEQAAARRLKKMQFFNKDFSDFIDDPFDIITCLGVLAKTNFSLDEFFRHTATLLKTGGYIMADMKNKNWIKFNEKDFFPEPRHLWFSQDFILKSATAQQLFEVVNFCGFLPSEGRSVPCEASHTVYLVARRTDVPISKPTIEI